MVRQRAATGRGARHSSRDAGFAQHAAVDCRRPGRRPGFSVLVLLPPHARQRLAHRARAAERSICTARCCRSTAAAHRCIGPFSRANRRPAPACTTCWKSRMPARCVDQQAVPILENDTALEVSLKVAAAAAEVLRRSLPPSDRRQRRSAAARFERGLVLWPPPSGGRAHRLALLGSRSSRSGARSGAAVSGCLYRGKRV